MNERLLVATRNKLLIWDDGPIPIRVSPYNQFHHFYGITWSTSHIYVAEQVRHEQGVVHIFDGNLACQGQVSLESNLEAPHQILWWNGMLCITDAKPDRVLLWDGMHTTTLKWKREDRLPLHPNSIWCDGEKFYVLEHRGPKMPKWVRVLDLDFETVGHIEITRDIFKRKKYVHGIHNVYVENGVLHTLSPSAMIRYDLTSGKSDSITLNQVTGGEYYARGLARTEGKFFIGLSEIRERAERAEGESFILVTDDDFNVLDALKLEGTGALHEIRAVDSLDQAHNGLECPLKYG